MHERSNYEFLKVVYIVTPTRNLHDYGWHIKCKAGHLPRLG